MHKTLLIITHATCKYITFKLVANNIFLNDFLPIHLRTGAFRSISEIAAVPAALDRVRIITKVNSGDSLPGNNAGSRHLESERSATYALTCYATQGFAKKIVI